MHETRCRGEGPSQAPDSRADLSGPSPRSATRSNVGASARGLYGAGHRKDWGLSWIHRGAAPREGRPMTGSAGGFELRGINHLALVCRDMERTVDFYTNVLGMPLVKTIELPAGMGQHFFFDCGGGDSPGLLLVPGRPRRGARRQRTRSPSGPGRPHQRHRLHEPRRLRRGTGEDRGVPGSSPRRRDRLHRDRQSRRLRVRHQRRPCTRASTSAASTSRIPTASCSSSPAGCARSNPATSPTRPARAIEAGLVAEPEVPSEPTPV